MGTYLSLSSLEKGTGETGPPRCSFVSDIQRVDTPKAAHIFFVFNENSSQKIYKNLVLFLKCITLARTVSSFTFVALILAEMYYKNNI